jgi:LSD1 subclass zinc finger protein
MQTRKILLIFSFAIFFAVVMGALVTRSNLGDRNTTLVVTQETSLQDGASLLNIRCAQCHTVELIKQTNQTRAEWENTLAQMKTMGVNLSADEKIVLIEYLTDISRP